MATTITAPTNQSARQNWPRFDEDLPTAAPVQTFRAATPHAPDAVSRQQASRGR
jgi:hypothetical protein